LENEDIVHHANLLDLNSRNPASMDILEEEDHSLEENATDPQIRDIHGESTDIGEERECSLYENDTDPPSQDFDAESTEYSRPLEAEAHIAGEDDHRGDLHENVSDPQIQDSEGESTDSDSIKASSKHARQEFNMPETTVRIPAQTVRRIDSQLIHEADIVQTETVSELLESGGWPGASAAFFTNSKEAFSASETHTQHFTRRTASETGYALPHAYFRQRKLS
jgi:hypothetical protein